MFAMPRYEVKYHDWDKWEELSEIEFVHGLYKIFNERIIFLMRGSEFLVSEYINENETHWVDFGERNFYFPYV